MSQGLIKEILDQRPALSYIAVDSDEDSEVVQAREEYIDSLKRLIGIVPMGDVASFIIRIGPRASVKDYFPRLVASDEEREVRRLRRNEINRQYWSRKKIIK
jgi:hypothetical protein